MPSFSARSGIVALLRIEDCSAGGLRACCSWLSAWFALVRRCHHGAETAQSRGGTHGFDCYTGGHSWTSRRPTIRLRGTDSLPHRPLNRLCPLFSPGVGTLGCVASSLPFRNRAAGPLGP